MREQLHLQNIALNSCSAYVVRLEQAGSALRKKLAETKDRLDRIVAVIEQIQPHSICLPPKTISIKDVLPDIFNLPGEYSPELEFFCDPVSVCKEEMITIGLERFMVDVFQDPMNLAIHCHAILSESGREGHAAYFIDHQSAKTVGIPVDIIAQELSKQLKKNIK